MNRVEIITNLAKLYDYYSLKRVDATQALKESYENDEGAADFDNKICNVSKYIVITDFFIDRLKENGVRYIERVDDKIKVKYFDEDGKTQEILIGE